MRAGRELWGWTRFVLCAITFVVAGVRDGDRLMTLGSMMFVAACILFRIPYFTGQ